VAEDRRLGRRLVGSSGRQYDLLAVGAHGLGRQQFSQLGGVVARVLRGVEKDVLIVRDDRSSKADDSSSASTARSYSYKAMKAALELAQTFGGSLYVCSAFDVEYTTWCSVTSGRPVLPSVQGLQVRRARGAAQQHSSTKGLLKLCQANLKRAEVDGAAVPEVPIKNADPDRKPFQVIMQWAEEVKRPLMVLARHGAHRIEGTDLGS